MDKQLPDDYVPPPVVPPARAHRGAGSNDRNPNIYNRDQGPPGPLPVPAERGKPPFVNPNFVRADDPLGRTSCLGDLSHKNFVTRTQRDLAATHTERVSGVAVRRQGESKKDFDRRTRELAEEKGEREVGGAPEVLAGELERLERRWKGKVPTPEMRANPERMARLDEEFTHMNALRRHLGRAEVNYWEPRTDDTELFAQTRTLFTEFQTAPTDKRLRAVETLVDVALLRVIAVHDINDQVRDLADRRLGLLQGHALIGQQNAEL